MLPPQINDLLQTKAMQIALAISFVLLAAMVVFAVGWSIVTGQPLNAIVANILFTLFGATTTVVGGQAGARHFQNGIRSMNTVSTAVTGNTSTTGKN